MYNESQPFGEFIRTLLRYLPLVALLMALSGAAAFVLTTPRAPEPVASSQIGLTQQVVWPFYDTARQRTVSYAEEDGFVAELEDRVNTSQLTVEVVAPEQQAFVLAEVTASSPEVAALAVDEAADMLLERDMARLTAAAEAELAKATSVLQASQARDADLEARLNELIPAEAEAAAVVGLNPGSSSAREDLLSAGAERTSLTQLRNEELRQQVGMQVAVEEARADVGAIVPELEILRRAGSPTAAEERSWVPVAAAAAAAMVIGLGLAITWDRTRGPLASRWHAEQVAGVPVLADMGPRRHRDRAAGLFLSGLVDGAELHGNVVALAGLKGVKTDRWLAMIVQYFQLAGVRVVVIGPAGSERRVYGDGMVRDWREVTSAPDLAKALDGVSTIELPPTVMLLDSALMRPAVRRIAEHCHLVLLAGGIVEDEDSDLAVALADTTVLIARKGANRVDQLRRGARVVGERREALLGVVLGSNRLPAVASTPVQPAGPSHQPTNGADPEESRPIQWT